MKYAILSRADLPVRMQRIFTEFDEAYLLCCEWNQTHSSKDLAFPFRLPEHGNDATTYGQLTGE